MGSGLTPETNSSLEVPLTAYSWPRVHGLEMPSSQLQMEPECSGDTREPFKVALVIITICGNVGFQFTPASVGARSLWTFWKNKQQPKSRKQGPSSPHMPPGPRSFLPGTSKPIYSSWEMNESSGTSLLVLILMAIPERWSVQSTLPPEMEFLPVSHLS